MNGIILAMTVIPCSLIVFILAYEENKRNKQFILNVEKHIVEKHPELEIVKKFGFGFDLKIDDRIYRACLHDVYKKSKQKNSNSEKLIEAFICNISKEPDNKFVIELKEN